MFYFYFSGLTTSSVERGVTPVYLRCTAGRVTWLYPRGALRVLLRLPGQDKEFRACIKVHPDSEKYLAARLFLEGPRSLLPLYSHDDGGHKAVRYVFMRFVRSCTLVFILFFFRCFQSRNGHAALYIEAIDTDTMIKRVAEIEYDLQPLPSGTNFYDVTEGIHHFIFKLEIRSIGNFSFFGIVQIVLRIRFLSFIASLSFGGILFGCHESESMDKDVLMIKQA